MKDIRFWSCALVLIVAMSCKSREQKHINTLNVFTDDVDSTCWTQFKSGYNYYWLKDSLGTNGYRILLGEYFLRKCDWRNTKWSEVSKYLGNPTARRREQGTYYFRYRLSEGDWDSTGMMFLEVRVVNDVITYFMVRQIDG